MDKQNIEVKNPDTLLPQAESLPAPIEEKSLVEDEALLGIYDEILTDIRRDRKQVNYFVKQFADALANDGDASTSSKEALVNLLKLKSDAADKMSKIADLMTRIKLKDRWTGHPYMLKNEADDKPTITITSNKRELIKNIRAAKKGGNDEQ